MKWNLFTLKVFAEVARQKSFTKAGRILGLTQPAVSFQVQNLEKQIGCPLMVRNRRGTVELTKTGEVLYHHIQKIYEFLQDLEAQLYPLTRHSNRQVVVGCCCIAGEHVVLAYGGASMHRWSQVIVHWHVGRCADNFTRLVEGSLDVAIACIPPEDSRLAHHAFVRIPLCCFEASRAAARHLSIKDLVSEPLILGEGGAGTRRALVRFLRKHGLSLDRCSVVVTSECIEAVKEMVAKDLGWSIVPRMVIQEELSQRRLSPIELKEGRPVQEFFVVYRKQGLMSDQLNDFIQFLLQTSPELPAQ
ncbi:LysR family transcriptional regulator [Desulfosoma caldarium]|uniref:DNA-binding transcriptional LysR family regulator n=1 Tax=Desulfosoma caldarium TaxID=610254 RepID=A0A3N1UP10_9BACT|nr:LysR family transcriptional regulator [Desulfosoma caldarium]ROQ91139.1 DNA-binding transcriptional LysR family regulator [Desulfosoma caldarium]